MLNSTIEAIIGEKQTSLSPSNKPYNLQQLPPYKIFLCNNDKKVMGATIHISIRFKDHSRRNNKTWHLKLRSRD